MKAGTAMPVSMTGFGRGECLKYDRRFKVEIKSVNHRYGDITIKLPRFLNSYEDKVKKRLARDIVRGKVDVWIHFESFSENDVSVQVNTSFADAYVRALNELCTRYGLPEGGVTLPVLAQNTEVLSIDKDMSPSNEAEIYETLLTAVENALTQFNAMRQAEGKALVADILDKRERIGQLLTGIKERAPFVAVEYAAKFTERINETLKGSGITADEGRLLTEIALFTDRSCIDEEITRLESHLKQLAAMLNEKGAVGRKLDFLVQELNREANTIGSKANDAQLARLVVDLKSEVEKIREQVQNIE
jgi:uncharacterized protein (TIGR00255 family)